MSGPYDDIIDLPHPTSERHPRMPMAARLTDGKIELTEEEKANLDARLQLLEPGIAASFTYFQPDSRKQGGAYVTASGEVKRIDGIAREIILMDGRRIPIDDILEVG